MELYSSNGFGLETVCHFAVWYFALWLCSFAEIDFLYWDCM